MAILIGFAIATSEAKRTRQNPEDYLDMGIIGVIAGIAGARIYYVIFSWDMYKDDLLDIFNLREGGLAIYGAVIGGFVAIVYYAKKQKQSIIKTTDIIVPGLLLAQGIGRWGNFFNQEAHGPVVSLEFLEKLHLPQFIIDGMHINGLYYAPTFLYESLWCVLGFVILIIIRKITKRKTGIMTCSYFIWYGLGRLYIEGMRTDSLYLGSLRISQIVSLLLIIIGIIGIIVVIIKKHKGRRKANE